jgi:hypothetical protein
MPSTRGLSLLLTASQAADRLGVTVERVLLWAAEGRLRVAGQDENGRALFREHIIESIGADLVALTPPEGRRQRNLRPDRDVDPHVPRLVCGCNPARSALHLCRTGAALNAALQLAETLAVAIPDDPLLRKLAGLCRETLMKHLMPAVVVTTASAPRRSSSDWPASAGEIAAAGSRLTQTASEERTEIAVS